MTRVLLAEDDTAIAEPLFPRGRSGLTSMLWLAVTLLAVAGAAVGRGPIRRAGVDSHRSRVHAANGPAAHSCANTICRNSGRS